MATREALWTPADLFVCELTCQGSEAARAGGRKAPSLTASLMRGSGLEGPDALSTRGRGDMAGSERLSSHPFRPVGHGTPCATKHRHKLTVIVPCFNERETILELLRRLNAVPIDKLVIVVDNCSTDGTRQLLRSMCSVERRVGHDAEILLGGPWTAGQTVLDGPGFHVVLQPANYSKSASIKLGIALADSEYVICQDADLEYDPTDIARLLAHAESSGAVAVFGSRLARSSGIPMDAFQAGRVGLTKLFCLLFDSDITDVATCYKLVKTDLIRDLRLESSGFNLDFELPARLRKRRVAIAELPISYRPRNHAHGKKIRWRDGLRAGFMLLKLWLQP